MNTTTTALYDALTLEIERADALSGHLEDRLSARSEGRDDEPELYALSIIARDLCDKHQRILEKARTLYEELTPPEDKADALITRLGSLTKHDVAALVKRSERRRRKAGAR
jgi:hypothetical protein